MKTKYLPQRLHQEASALVAMLILMLVVSGTLAALAGYVTHTLRMGEHRTSWTKAVQFSQGGAAIGADDLNQALTNGLQTLDVRLVSTNLGYTLLTATGQTANQKIFQRTIASPFSNQTVLVKIIMTNSTSPSFAAIKSTAVVNGVPYTSTLNVILSFGFGAAIISDSPGSTSTGLAKSDAQQGNVVINGDTGGPTVIDGGGGLAIWANGRGNYDALATVSPTAVLANTYNTASQVPDYTLEGSPDQLFDFKRFIAVADVSKTHYTNLTQFFASNNAAFLTPAGALEGVIVVDIYKSDPKFTVLDPTSLPNGINVRGTLMFNFSSEFVGSDKIFNTATVNVNKANLSGLNPANPATYTTGYPPTYYDASKKPSNVDISSKGFSNFAPSDDLPAMMYNIGIFDIHGNANVCGVMYTPSFMEIENKKDSQIQYFKGALIGGAGVYVENLKISKSVVSYDPLCLDLLATAATKGKRVIPTYWE